MKDSNLTCQYSNTFAMYFFSSLIIVKNYLYVVTSDKSHKVEILIGESKVEIVENKLYFFFLFFIFRGEFCFHEKKVFIIEPKWEELRGGKPMYCAFTVFGVIGQQRSCTCS